MLLALQGRLLGKLRALEAVGLWALQEVRKVRLAQRRGGFDDVIDYKSEDVNARISQTCPNKLDVYFDNVGGDILEAALNHLNLKARIVMCGGISGYNATQPIPGPSNLMNIVTTRSRMEGFIILDYMARAPEAINELLGWIGSGELEISSRRTRGVRQHS